MSPIFIGTIKYAQGLCTFQGMSRDDVRGVEDDRALTHLAEAIDGLSTCQDGCGERQFLVH
ncbi:hypothetical protein D3C77_666120 [compost metagenome]